MAELPGLFGNAAGRAVPDRAPRGGMPRPAAPGVVERDGEDFRVDAELLRLGVELSNCRTYR
ncbi:hypothetical protein APS67_005393 [Streptomyces sp. AVP053U2]|nr:hypothetical protein APS67_005393 [Streptomyces sp. AVP053U2]